MQKLFRIPADTRTTFGPALKAMLWHFPRKLPSGYATTQNRLILNGLILSLDTLAGI